MTDPLPNTEPYDVRDDGSMSWRHRIALGMVLAAVALAAYLLREHLTGGVSAEIAQARRAEADALARHAAVLAEMNAGRLDLDRFADAIERETLPLWSEAVRHARAAKDAGVKGRAIDEYLAYLEARKRASEKLVAATRSKDPASLDEAKREWAEAERVGGKLMGKVGR